MRVRVGDLIEIKTSKGLAYALFTHKHEKPPHFGAMLRVFDQTFESRPAELVSLTRLPVQFTTFFPLQAAVNQKLVEVVGNFAIPDELKPFPIFRAGVPDPHTKTVANWWLWDGEKEWQVGKLTTNQRKFPIRGVWNDTYLIQRIENGWRPENDSR